MRARAGELRKELKQATGMDAKIKWGAPGGLDVLVDGRLIFSAKQAGRLPSAEEIVKAVQ